MAKKTRITPGPAKREKGIPNSVKGKFNRHLHQIGRRIPTDPEVYERLLIEWLEARPEVLAIKLDQYLEPRIRFLSSKARFLK